MAKMIPSQIPKTIKSGGERQLFTKLKDDSTTADWVVLHSFDIPNHVKNISGEIDFVVIVPGKGVLCLEVKGTKKVTRTPDGAWIYGDSQPEYTGPFKQAEDGMHSLREALKKKYKSLSGVLFCSAVVFPFIPFKEEGEWHSWQVIDHAKFSSVSKSILNVLDFAADHVKSKETGFWYKDNGQPTEEQVSILVEAMRPHFEYIETAKMRGGRLEKELLECTEEQYQCLDSMESNDRVLYSGPAGSGKTVLAIEALRRATMEGKTARLICYNKILGAWLNQQAEVIAPGSYAGHIDQLMVDIIGGQSKIPSHPNSAFWSEDLPNLAIDKLLGAGNLEVVDVLILDEAQDLLRPIYLDFMQLLLEKGWEGSVWKMFGDFDNQLIYDKDIVDVAQFTQDTGATRYSIRTNCRNTPSIVESISLHTRLNPYSSVRRPDRSVDAEIFYYSDETEQQLFLEERLTKLYEDQFNGYDIIILSPYTNGAASKIVSHPWAQRLSAIESTKGGQIPYTTIHRFKGMEKHAVIITDIDDLSDKQYRDMLYIGMTRAVDRVYVLASGKVRKQISSMITEEYGSI